jgi:hypothetical protein
MSNDKLNIKINCINHPNVFNKIYEVADYITDKIIKADDLYIFTIIKESHKITIKMRNISNIIDYIFSHHIIYFLDDDNIIDDDSNMVELDNMVESNSNI